MRASQDDIAIAALVEGLTFDTLLHALSQARGTEAALSVPPGQSPPRPGSGAFSFAALNERVDRLAALLALAGAPQGSAVAILAPLGAEALVAILGSLRAGLSPLALPVHADEEALLRWIEAAGATMAIGVDRIGTLTPLLTLRNLALRAFGLRFVGGFGTEIPDGVAPLDTLATQARTNPQERSRGELIVVDGYRDGPPVRLREPEVLAHALEISRLLKPLAASRIVSCLTGCDLAALASGPGIALLAGVEFLPLGLFQLEALRESLDAGGQVHLVVPAALEPALAHARLASHPNLASLVFVRRTAEPALPAVDRPDLAIIDIEATAPDAITVGKR